MSTQPIPTFPMVAGYEKYFGLTPLELVDTHLSNSPDLQKMHKSFDIPYETRFKTDEEEANFYCKGIPYLKDFFLELVKMDKDRDTYTMHQRFSITDILFSIYENTSP
jgi:hypothetical protein